MDAQTGTSIAALLVAFIALVGTSLQVLQQYLASASGYSYIDEKVIGKWHTKKRRVFLWKELRFEVQFESPVIFVCSPTNTNGPVPKTPIEYITPESLNTTLNALPHQPADISEPQSPRDRIHTADVEVASWWTLLLALQFMEKESHEWELKQHKSNALSRQPPEFREQKLAVAVQPKKRTWNNMPSSLKKPSATTTMCHMIEMTAMLGLHWKEFDRSRDKYRAEGNAYILTGSHLPDLGIAFSFQVYGKSKFEETRIIPVDEVKELAFGFVSTLFRQISDNRRIEVPEEYRDLSVLRLGSPNELAETLVSFGCNTTTANYIRSNETRHGHLFPLAFEIVGMLGKIMHVKNSYFRMLPNPTLYHWDKKFFNMRELLLAYDKNINDYDLVPYTSVPMSDLRNKSGIVARALRTAQKERGDYGFTYQLLNELHEALEKCNEILTKAVPPDMVERILREHVQIVLHMMNETTDGSNQEQITVQQRLPTFADLDSAPPETKQNMLMDLYFITVLPEVIERATKPLDDPNSTRVEPNHHNHSRSATEPAQSPPLPPFPGPPSRAQTHATGEAGNAKQEQSANTWCTLVFRMLCWLLLHDFHRNDVQIAKSELMGSRLPVYII